MGGIKSERAREKIACAHALRGGKGRDNGVAVRGLLGKTYLPKFMGSCFIVDQMKIAAAELGGCHRPPGLELGCVDRPHRPDPCRDVAILGALLVDKGLVDDRVDPPPGLGQLLGERAPLDLMTQSDVPPPPQ